LEKIKLQRVSEEQRDELFEAVVRYWTELMPHAPVVRDPSIRPLYYASQFELGAPDCYQWWAVLDDERIGFANLQLAADPVGRTWAAVNDFYVEPGYRRQGCGRAFVRALVDWLKEQGVYRIDLHVRSDSPGALAFWQSLGFTLASYRLRTYLD
jgi:GNAT superfamily N-acetyltransferase